MLNGIKKILIIRFNGVGDIIMTMPSLKALKQAYPQAEITWLVDERCKEAISHEPLVDEVLTIHRKDLDHMPRLQAAKWLWSFITNLRRSRFDLVVDLQGFSETCWLTYITGARYRLGHRVKPGIVDRADFQGFAYNIPVTLPGPTIHRVEYFFEIVRAVDATIKNPDLFFFVSAAKKRSVREFLKKQGIKTGDQLVGLNPGPGGTAKCWRPEHFAVLADMLIKKLKVKLLLRGSPGDEELIDRIKGMMKAKVIVASPTDLQELGAFAASCRVFVSNDTGPMHLSTAVKTPTLGLFGMTHPELSGPWGKGHVSLSAANYQKEGDMDQITVQMVFDKIKQMLAKGKK